MRLIEINNEQNVWIETGTDPLLSLNFTHVPEDPFGYCEGDPLYSQADLLEDLVEFLDLFDYLPEDDNGYSATLEIPHHPENFLCRTYICNYRVTIAPSEEKMGTYRVTLLSVSEISTTILDRAPIVIEAVDAIILSDFMTDLKETIKQIGGDFGE